MRVDVNYGTTNVETGAPLGPSPYRDSTLSPFHKLKRGLLTRIPTTTTTSFEGRTAVVTGASAGVGLALSIALSERLHMRVIAVGRREKVEISENVTYMQFDVRDDPTPIFEAYDVDVLINNAGLSLPGAVIRNGNQAACEEVFAVNTLAPVQWTRTFLRRLEQRRAPYGHVVNIASMSAHRLTTPALGIYAASKAALNSITESTRLDLRKANLPYRVSMLSPALIGDTNFFGSASSSSSSCDGALRATDVVDAVLFVLQAPPTVEVHDIRFRATTSRD